MGKWWSYVLCAGLLLFAAGCTDNPYIGPYDPINHSYSKLPIEIALGGSYQSGTKSYGTISNYDDFNGRKMYVYGIRRDSLALYNDPVNYLVDNDTAIVDKSHGRLRWIESLSAPAHLFYPQEDDMEKRRPHDFFAYHVDDAHLTSQPRKEKDHIYIPLEIDGSQDLILCKADLPQTASANLEELEPYAFSYLTALNNVLPTINPLHQLACLHFTIKGAYEPLSPDVDFKINSVSLDSPYKLNMIVAAQKADTMGVYLTSNSTRRFIRDRRDEEVRVHVTHSPDEESSVYFGDILLPETLTESTTLTVEIARGISGNAQGLEYQTVINHPNFLLKGKKYNVTLIMHSDVISTEVELVPWYFGGEILIDKGDNPDISFE